MKTVKKHASLIALRDTDRKAWHKLQIETYQAELSIYTEYASTMAKLLHAAAKLHAPLAIVQTRPKTLSSFAEKAIRKSKKYVDPVHQLTDLCGGRVITITDTEMRRTCEFIKENFIIDEANSLDVSERLSAAEFGYRSIHYVVQLKPDNPAGIPVPGKIGARKAEIQVRTLFQHAYAELAHDHIYKNKIKVPAALQREAYRLAALLEESEATCSRVVERIDAFGGNYAAYMTRQEMHEEIDALTTIRENQDGEDKKRETALRIAAIARAAGDWQRVIDELSPFVETADADLLRELGHAYCEAHESTPMGPEYAQGQGYLQQATGLAPNDAAAHTLLADTWTRLPNHEDKARAGYCKAFETNPENPYHFAAFLEFELFLNRHQALLGPMAPSIRRAIEQCQTHTEIGIELPRAFFTMGQLHILLGEPYESLDAYCKAVQMCIADDAGVPETVIQAQLDTLQRLESIQYALPGRDWVRRSLLEAARRLLLLARSIKFNPDEPLAEILDLKLADYDPKTPVVIVAGGCDMSVVSVMERYREHLTTALDEFHGTVISGGTTAGIGGLIGDIAEDCRDSAESYFETIGYHPKNIPADVTLDRRYDRLHATDDKEFSALEPLQSWIDLTASGIAPGAVRLLGINGGEIAGFEYRLATALGARVGIIQDSGRSATEILRNPHWNESSALQALPDDRMTLRAFFDSGTSPLSAVELEKAGQGVHENYLTDHHQQAADSALNPWDRLAEHLKRSNRAQAAYAANILAQAGYGVRARSKEEIQLPEFSIEEIELMAEMEHGRWNAERLADGWRFGPRDPDRKISPYLVPWNKLENEIQEYDRQAVGNFPQVLKTVGLEVFKG